MPRRWRSAWAYRGQPKRRWLLDQGPRVEYRVARPTPPFLATRSSLRATRESVALRRFFVQHFLAEVLDLGGGGRRSGVALFHAIHHTAEGVVEIDAPPVGHQVNRLDRLHHRPQLLVGWPLVGDACVAPYVGAGDWPLGYLDEALPVHLPAADPGEELERRTCLV